MTFYPQGAATEEDGPSFGVIASNQIRPQTLTKLLESKKSLTMEAKLSNESAKFHEDRAKHYGVNTARGMAHFKASRAYREGAGKLMEFFNQQPQQSQQPTGSQLKAKCQVHKDSVAFHKRMANKAGLDTPEGQAHVALLQHHMGQMKNMKDQKKQMKQSAAGASGRKPPMPGMPDKKQMKNPDVHQNDKPMVQLRQGDANKQEARRKKREAGGLGQFVAQRYDKSHPEGFESPEYAGVKKMKTGGPGSGPHGKSDKETLLSRAGRTLKNLNSARDKYPNHHPTVQVAQRAHNKSLRALRSALKSTEARRPGIQGREEH